MNNEKFQDLVLEHFAKLTQEITELKIGQDELRTGQDELRTGLDELRVGQDELRAGQKELRADLTELKVRQERLESKVDLVYIFSAKLAEDLAVTNQKLDGLSEDVKYLKYKEAQNEEDLFKVKSYLKIV